jgi:hypothetical protein
MLDGDAHLSTTSDGELRMAQLLISKTQVVLRIPEQGPLHHLSFPDPQAKRSPYLV